MHARWLRRSCRPGTKPPNLPQTRRRRWGPGRPEGSSRRRTAPPGPPNARLWPSKSITGSRDSLIKCGVDPNKAHPMQCRPSDARTASLLWSVDAMADECGQETRRSSYTRGGPCGYIQGPTIGTRAPGRSSRWFGRLEAHTAAAAASPSRLVHRRTTTAASLSWEPPVVPPVLLRVPGNGVIQGRRTVSLVRPYHPTFLGSS